MSLTATLASNSGRELLVLDLQRGSDAFSCNVRYDGAHWLSHAPAPLVFTAQELTLSVDAVSGLLSVMRAWLAAKSQEPFAGDFRLGDGLTLVFGERSDLIASQKPTVTTRFVDGRASPSLLS